MKVKALLAVILLVVLVTVLAGMNFVTLKLTNNMSNYFIKNYNSL